VIVVLPSCRREVEGLPDARVIYALVLRGSIHVLHAFRKTTQATPQRSIAVAERRLQEVIA
jgi:phage-related protein